MKILRAEIANKNMELNQISDQYKKLRIENNNLIQEIRKFANENERLNIIRSQGEQNSQLFMLQNKSQKIEINELNKNYNNVIKEKEKLKQNLQIFVDENKACAAHIKELENDLNNYQTNAQKLLKDKNDLIGKLNEGEKKIEFLTNEINQLKMALNKKNNEIIQNSLRNANNIININNNHNNINNSVMMNNNVVSDNEMINLLNQKIYRMNSDYKTLETQIKMYKEEKKICKDTIQRLQYENISLKKELDIYNSNNNIFEPVNNRYKQQSFKSSDEIDKSKKNNIELDKQKNNSNILNTQNSVKDNENEDEKNDDGMLKAEQL
jgi:chromosome segregation ATPase